jgi:hypothetical protein
MAAIVSCSSGVPKVIDCPNVAFAEPGTLATSILHQYKMKLLRVVYGFARNFGQ